MKNLGLVKAFGWGGGLEQWEKRILVMSAATVVLLVAVARGHPIKWQDPDQKTGEIGHRGSFGQRGNAVTGWQRLRHRGP